MHLPDDNIIPQPTVHVVRIGGVDVLLDPTGSFEAADVVIDAEVQATVEIEAENIPAGTVLRLNFSSEEWTGVVAVDSTPLDDPFLKEECLTGVGIECTKATATITLPRGFTQMYMRASWEPAP